jgi:polysaccharide biosynthesis transport protein
MASVDYSVTGEEVPQKGALRRAQPDVADLVGIARRGWFYIAAGAIIGLLVGAALLSNLAPVYKASSRIAFERTLSRYLQTNKITNEPLIEDADTYAQIYVISSESVLLPVVKALSLASDPEFVGEQPKEGVGSRVREFFRTAAHAFGLPDEKPKQLPTQDDLEKRAVDSMLRNLSATREDVPSVISVTFSSKDPVKASTIANTIVDTYLDAGVAGKVRSPTTSQAIPETARRPSNSRPCSRTSRPRGLRWPRPRPGWSARRTAARTIPTSPTTG